MTLPDGAAPTVSPGLRGFRSASESGGGRPRSWSRAARVARAAAPAGLLVRAGAPAAAQRPDSAAAAPRPRWTVLPVLGSAPETDLQVGGMLLRVSRPRGASATSRPTTNRLLARLTTRNQFMLEYERDAWFAEDRWRLLTNVEYSRFPLAYYGIGPDSPASAEELYTPSTINTILGVQRRFRRGLYAGIGYQTWRTWMRGVAADGELVRGTVPGSRGGTVAALELSLIADARDNIYAPRTGHFVTAQWAPAFPAIGSQFTYTRTLLDARVYRPLRAGFTFAAKGLFEDIGGTAPFERLPTIGSSTFMRGYERGRYRDGTLGAAQVELRRDLFWRVAGAVWGGAGSVAPRPGALANARLLPTFGVGGRWYLFPRERIAARADLAFGRGATGFYLSIGEAF